MKFPTREVSNRCVIPVTSTMCSSSNTLSVTQTSRSSVVLNSQFVALHVSAETCRLVPAALHLVGCNFLTGKRLL